MGTHDGHDALRDGLRRVEAAAAPAPPRAQHPRHRLERPRGRRAISDVVFILQGDAGWAIQLVGRYHDMLHRDDGTWRFHRREASSWPTTPAADAFRTRRRATADAVGRGRAPRAVRRGAGLRRRVGLRPLPTDVRRGTGRGVRGHDHARRAGRRHVAHPPRAARDRRDLPAPVGVRRAGAHDRPRVARPSRALARRGVVRRGAPRARHPVPVDAARASTCSRTRSRSCSGCSPATSSPTTGESCRCTTRSSVPSPVQQPHPPIWIGGSGPRRTLPLVARYADVWHTWGTPNSLRETNARLDELAAEAGRDPASIMRASSLSLDDLDTAAQARVEVARRRLRLPRVRLARSRSIPGRGVRPRRDARAHRLTPSSRSRGQAGVKRSGSGSTQRTTLVFR